MDEEAQEKDETRKVDRWNNGDEREKKVEGYEKGKLYKNELAEEIKINM